MAYQYVKFYVLLLLVCIGQISTNLYPGEMGTAAQALAKQHEALLNTLGNQEVRMQQSLLPYLQELERNNTAILDAINKTNPRVIPLISLMLAADIGTVTVGLDPLINDLLAYHNITNYHPIAQQLFRAIIIMAVANKLNEIHTPNTDQCRQVSFTIEHSLEVCARILKEELPLLSPSLEKESKIRRMLTWACYITLATVAIGFIWYTYAQLHHLYESVNTINTTVTATQTVTDAIKQQVEQQETPERKQPNIISVIAASDSDYQQESMQTSSDVTSDQQNATDRITIEQGQVLANAYETNRHNIEDLDQRVTRVEGQVEEFGRILTHETKTLTSLTKNQNAPEKPATATHSRRPSLTVRSTAILTNLRNAVTPIQTRPTSPVIPPKRGHHRTSTSIDGLSIPSLAQLTGKAQQEAPNS